MRRRLHQDRQGTRRAEITADRQPSPTGTLFGFDEPSSPPGHSGPVDPKTPTATSPAAGVFHARHSHSHPFPPSEGEQYFREIVPPSKGEFSRHDRHSICSGVSVPSSPFPPSEGVRFSRKIVPPSEGHPSSTTAAFSAFRCRCGMAFLTDPLLQTPCATFSFRHLSTTAAFPAFLCRCGIAFLTTPLLQAFWTALPSCSSSTTALFPAILCRCGSSLRKVQAKVAFHRHLPEPAEPAGTVSLSVNRMPSRWSTSCWKMTAV